MYFFYGWWDGPGVNQYCPNGECYGRGFADPGNNPRDTNAYGQNKWVNTKSLVQRMKKWEPYIMSFDNANRKSYIYRIQSERTSMQSNTS